MNESNNNHEPANDGNMLLGEGVIFTYSKLGQPFFLRENATDCYKGISPRDWTSDELRKMADYIDTNPKCKLFSDGSGT